jgi:geranylgeranyl diphosphate synthase type I
MKRSPRAVFVEQLEASASSVQEFIRAMLQGEPKDLYLASSHYVNSGGKRLRPFLLMKSCEMLGGSPEAALPIAAAVEMIHNFALIHDDIMDDDDVRHGVSTVHKHFGIPLAILAGDTLLVKAFQSVVARSGKHGGLPPAVTIEIVARLTRTCVEMSEGQALDVARREKSAEPSESEHINVISKKTAALFQTSCELGAICAEMNGGDLANLAAYGRNLGIAFQLIDDLLGVAGDPRLTHKPVGTDLREGKTTLPILLALKRAKGPEREQLLRVMGSKTASTLEMNKALAIFKNLAIDDAVRSAARVYAGNAAGAIETYGDSASKQALKSAAEFVVERTA